MKPVAWVAARWQNLGVLVACAVGVGSAFAPWVRASRGSTAVTVSGLDSTMAVAWFQRNAGLPRAIPDVPDAAVTLVVFGLALLGLYRTGLDRPQRVAWGWRVTGGILALLWSGFELLVIGASRIKIPGQGTLDAGPGFGLVMVAAAGLVLLSVALAAIPTSSRDATYVGRKDRPHDQFFR